MIPISIETSEVLLPVTVRDSSGRLVMELQRQDFRVFEDGREQTLSDLARRQVPVDGVLMIDTSETLVLSSFRREVLLRQYHTTARPGRRSS